MAEVTARNEPGRALTVVIDTGAHQLLADEPVAVGGDDLGPGPYQLLLASLASCMVMTLELYARRKGWPLESVQVRVRHGRRDALPEDDLPAGRRIDRITYAVDLAGPLAEEQRSRLLEIAARCPVHRTLTGKIEIVRED